MIITLCGSTRFQNDFNHWNMQLGKAGYQVFSLSCFGRQASDIGKAETQPLITDEEKIRLDLNHLKKIDASDAILVINPAGYIGESTAREIAWAKLSDKAIFYQETEEGARTTANGLPAGSVFLLKNLFTGGPI